MRAPLIFAGFALMTGCIEYEPTSTLPPLGVPNQRPLEIETNTDKLVQVTVPVVDILWIIDNSTSMLDEQNALTTNFPVFMDYFLGSGLDYHIGVISTDYAADQGRLEYAVGYKWVDDETVDPISVFQQMAGLGIKIGTNEKGRDPAYAALELNEGPGGWNEGFERDDGGLHLVVISDEDDHSDLIDRQEFIDYLETSRPDPDDVTFSSIVTPLNNCSPNGVEPGAEYVETTNAVGGILWSICNTDWVGVLEQLGMQAAGLQREYFLSDLPVPGSIKVWVEDQGTVYEFEPEIDYLYDPNRNSIIFVEFVPSSLAEVFIEYDVLESAEEEGGEDHADDPQGVVAVAAEEKGEVGEHADGPGDGGRDGHHEGVAVLDVGQLVGHDARHFFAAQRPEKPRRRGDGRVFGVSPGGEGVRLVGFDDVDLRHGEVCVAGQILDHVDQIRSLARADLAGVVHPEHGGVRGPEGKKVHPQGDDKGERHAGLTAEEIADREKEAGHRSQKQCRSCVAHGQIPPVSSAGYGGPAA